ncbi:uncharacterized protein BDW43DRAFT_273810 [Aspergillus alliaceus]|uniref:uncharacterized protein n=1 Tax=Petromyces alliaceus TaxID=209559 RepID=UPI0012A525B5|nr:uncharacterized protein BDW43DRAFT_273810 [Aspergillus alliaceus]KAB8234315.1 hypothetical protein BDW43DRAFT_273810 [Aspergillus alliaceus]
MIWRWYTRMLSCLLSKLLLPMFLVSPEDGHYLVRTKWQATECVIEPVVRSSNKTVRKSTHCDKTLAIWTEH